MRPSLIDIISCLEANGLLKGASLQGLSPGTVFSDVTFDDRTAGKDSLFVCKGAMFKEDYLLSAFEKGAILYVAERAYQENLPHLLVGDIRLAMSKLAVLFFSHEASSVIKIGITGTKGKTTVAAFLNAVLDTYCMRQYSRRSALISSLFTYDGIVDKPSVLTTPEAIELWRHLANAAKSEIPYAVCEISSQAMKYHRASDVTFDAALFLNIGIDHISEIEHPDFDDYFRSKLKIFDKAEAALIHSATAYFEEVKTSAEGAGCRVYTFGAKESDTLRLLSSGRTSDTETFTVSYEGAAEEYAISLFGKHNIENALAAILAAKLLGIPYDDIRTGLLSARVAGRGIEIASRDGTLRVIVDYAHNGMSLEALYRYVETEYPDHRVITLFGCPGGKAKNRRGDMGKTAALHSDLVILTEDDPANEDLGAIIKEIAVYVEEENTPYLICHDRAAAIALAFDQAVGKTVLLLCGKGAENTQKRMNQTVSYETDEYFARQGIESYDAVTV